MRQKLAGLANGKTMVLGKKKKKGGGRETAQRVNCCKAQRLRMRKESQSSEKVAFWQDPINARKRGGIGKRW